MKPDGTNEKSRLATDQTTLESKNTVTHSDIGDRLQEADLLQGGFGLAKAARARQQNKAWNRPQRGFADLWLMLSLFQINCLVLTVLWGASL
jgi:hypothetical protein